MTDPYASEEQTLSLIGRDERTPAEKKIDEMMEERGAWEQGAEPFLILRQIAAEQMDAITSIKQAITDLENQPSQFGTVTMAYMQREIAEEREACARICDTTPPEPFRPSIEAAHAIRARGQA